MSSPPFGISVAAPLKCPLKMCNEIISPSMLVSHFMKFHQVSEFKSVEEKEKVLLLISISEDFPELEKTVCLGVLAFRASGSSHVNVLLPKQYELLDNHHPIVVMACRGNYVNTHDEEADSLDPDADFLAVWLCMPNQDGSKVSATITVHNEDLTKAFSSFVRVRGASGTQSIREFAETDSNVLIVNSGVFKQMTMSGRLYLEVSLIENLI